MPTKKPTDPALLFKFFMMCTAWFIVGFIIGWPDALIAFAITLGFAFMNGAAEAFYAHFQRDKARKELLSEIENKLGTRFPVK